MSAKAETRISMTDEEKTVSLSLLEEEIKNGGNFEQSLMYKDIIGENGSQEIIEYLIKNKEEILSELRERTDHEYDNKIFMTEFYSEVVDEIIHMLCDGLDLSYEDVATVVTVDLIKDLYGREFFYL